jgi:AraC-like DNA-binding protein
VSQEQYAKLLRVLRWRLRDEFWGLLDRPLPLGSFAQCCRLLVQTPTLGDALRTGFRFFHSEIDEFVPRLLVVDGMASMTIVPRADGHEYAQRSFLFLSFGLASWLAARRIPIAGVEYRGPAPQHAGEVDRLFQAKVAFGRERYRLWFDERWLQLPQVQNAQSLREFLQQAPANLLVKYRDRTRVTDRIRRLLRSRLRDELPSLDEVAHTLAMTPQTLSRRLREEGQGFQVLKDDLRRDTAIELLQRPDLTLLDIATQLGFSEASTFHRAFKKWTGVAPGEYRHRPRADRET